MRDILLILAVTAAASGAGAQEVGAEYEYAVPDLPVIQLCAMEEGTEDPVPFVSISVEYSDTIIASRTDEMGLLDFTPRSFPFTLTASGEGMMDATYGITEQPEGPLTILMTREPAERQRRLTFFEGKSPD